MVYFKEAMARTLLLLLLALICLVMFPLSSSATTPPSNRLKYFSMIKEVNEKGPYLGLITVYPPEEDAFFKTKAFKPHPKHPYFDFSGRRYRVGRIHGKRVIYVRCGVGMVNAAAVTQQMLDLFNVVAILHFGIAGNVNDTMSIGDVTIPAYVANTGIWDWLKPNDTLPPGDVERLDFGNYNLPKGGKGSSNNLLGSIGYSQEQFYSALGEVNHPRPLFWAEINHKWLKFAAATLKGVELEQCVNASMCLETKPKLVIGLKASTADIFLDNAAYREFLYQNFKVSSVDMESSAVVMTSQSNGIPVMVIRGMSDLAGGQPGKNPIDIYGPLAALNAAKAVVQLVKTLPEEMLH